jgi:two-component system OmpR family response regulator
VVDTYMSYLRAKVDAPFDAPIIHTVRGVGFTIRHRGA